MVYDSKETIEWSMERLVEKQRDPNLSNKERKVVNACLRCYKFRLKKFNKKEK